MEYRVISASKAPKSKSPLSQAILAYRQHIFLVS